MKPADCLASHRFGHSGAEWPVEVLPPTKLAGLAAAFMQHRLAVAVQEELSRRGWTVRRLAAILADSEEDAQIKKADDRLRLRLTGRAWLTAEDLAGWAAVLGSHVLRPLTDGDLLPRGFREACRPWVPGSGRLPTMPTAGTLGTVDWRAVAEHVGTAAARWTSNGRGHLTSSGMALTWTIEALGRCAVPSDRMRLITVPADGVEVDRPWRLIVVPVATSLHSLPRFEAFDDLAFSYVQSLFAQHSGDGRRVVIWILPRTVMSELLQALEGALHEEPGEHFHIGGAELGTLLPSIDHSGGMVYSGLAAIGSCAAVHELAVSNVEVQPLVVLILEVEKLIPE